MVFPFKEKSLRLLSLQIHVINHLKITEIVFGYSPSTTSLKTNSSAAYLQHSTRIFWITTTQSDFRLRNCSLIPQSQKLMCENFSGACLSHEGNFHLISCPQTPRSVWRAFSSRLLCNVQWSAGAFSMDNRGDRQTVQPTDWLTRRKERKGMKLGILFTLTELEPIPFHHHQKVGGGNGKGSWKAQFGRMKRTMEFRIINKYW